MKQSLGTIILISHLIWTSGQSWRAWGNQAFAETHLEPYGVEVVDAQGPFGPEPYDDPQSVLGAPATAFYDPLAQLWGGTPFRRVKLVEGACYMDPTRTQKLLTTFESGAYVVVRLGQPVRDDPAHPYGIDFLVFGNAFFPAVGFVDNDSDFNSIRLAGGCFTEPLKVSVSPGYTGQAGQDPTNWRTWEWYTYENGPYADSCFPTQAYLWDRVACKWTDQLSDFTKPVNPGLMSLFESPQAFGLTAADAVELYLGAGGGTGFDIRQTGFDVIRYVKIEACAPLRGGEIDALAAVRPAQLGDTLSITPPNIGNDTAKLVFKRDDQPDELAVAVEFLRINEVARVSSRRIVNPPVPVQDFGDTLLAVDLEATPMLSTEPLVFEANLMFNAGAAYTGNGDDLALIAWDGITCAALDCTYEPSSRTVIAKELKKLGLFALVKMHGPKLTFCHEFGRIRFGFTCLANLNYILERTTDFQNWCEVARLEPNEAGVVVLEDANPPREAAFYRLLIRNITTHQNHLQATQ